LSDSPYISVFKHMLGAIRKTLLIFLAILPSVLLAEDSKRIECSAPKPSELILTTTDFKWYVTYDEMRLKFHEIYTSGKRLLHRARMAEDGAGIELLHISDLGERKIPISQGFIDNLTIHIEKGLALGYFDYVFFPDMGHSHLWVPQQLLNDFISPIVTADQIAHFYHRVLTHPDTRFLYHTAEQLKMLDDKHNLLPDKHLNWRYFTRNIVGRNNGTAVLDMYRNLDSIANTVCEPAKGYALWSAGFYVSSSEKGCFVYKHNDKTHYFDISLSYPPTPPNELGALVSSDKVSSPSSSILWGLHGCDP